MDQRIKSYSNHGLYLEFIFSNFGIISKVVDMFSTLVIQEFNLI